MIISFFLSFSFLFILINVICIYYRCDFLDVLLNSFRKKETDINVPFLLLRCFLFKAQEIHEVLIKVASIKFYKRNKKHTKKKVVQVKFWCRVIK